MPVKRPQTRQQCVSSVWHHYTNVHTVLKLALCPLCAHRSSSPRYRQPSAATHVT